MLGQKSYTVKRNNSGTYVNGVWTPTGPLTLSIRGSLQPIDAETLESLDIGAKASAKYVLLAYEKEIKLRVAKAKGDFTCDIVVINNVDFRVLAVLWYGQHRLKHMVYVLGELTQ